MSASSPGALSRAIRAPKHVGHRGGYDVQRRGAGLGCECERLLEQERIATGAVLQRSRVDLEPGPGGQGLNVGLCEPVERDDEPRSSAPVERRWW